MGTLYLLGMRSRCTSPSGLIIELPAKPVRVEFIRLVTHGPKYTKGLPRDWGGSLERIYKRFEETVASQM